jgi:predicted RNA-binding Zn-ribbon protein involved in translation (DUF1610 family)
MSKKKNKEKCIKCGHRIALASTNAFNWEVEFDQEPYEADVIEPVIISGRHIESVEVSIHAICHVCPNCGWVRDIEMTCSD